MKRIYGNSYLLSVLDNMIAHNKAAHSLLIYGEKGCGKKLIADRYTAALLCESPVSGAPCGVCSACRNASKLLPLLFLLMCYNLKEKK